MLFGCYFFRNSSSDFFFLSCRCSIVYFDLTFFSHFAFSLSLPSVFLFLCSFSFVLPPCSFLSIFPYSSAIVIPTLLFSLHFSNLLLPFSFLFRLLIPHPPLPLHPAPPLLSSVCDDKVMGVTERGVGKEGGGERAENEGG